MNMNIIKLNDNVGERLQYSFFSEQGDQDEDVLVITFYIFIHFF